MSCKDNVLLQDFLGRYLWQETIVYFCVYIGIQIKLLACKGRGRGHGAIKNAEQVSGMMEVVCVWLSKSTQPPPKIAGSLLEY